MACVVLECFKYFMILTRPQNNYEDHTKTKVLHYTGDKILGRNVFCSAGRLLKIDAGV